MLLRARRDNGESVWLPTVLIGLLIVAAVALLWWLFQRWRLWRQQRRLMAWSGRQRQDDDDILLEGDGGLQEELLLTRRRARADTAAPLDPQAFVPFVSELHRFTVQLPAGWRVQAAASTEAVVCQAVCPASDLHYKRFSISWDDVSWTATSPDLFARALGEQIARTVAGTRIETAGLAYTGELGRSLPSGAVEVIYAVDSGPRSHPSDGDESIVIEDAPWGPASSSITAAAAAAATATPSSGSGFATSHTRLKLLNVVIMCGHGRLPIAGKSWAKAFTLTFAVDEPAFTAALPLARFIIDSFQLQPDAHTLTAEERSPLATGGAGDARGYIAPPVATPRKPDAGDAAVRRDRIAGMPSPGPQLQRVPSTGPLLAVAASKSSSGEGPQGLEDLGAFSLLAQRSVRLQLPRPACMMCRVTLDDDGSTNSSNTVSGSTSDRGRATTGTAERRAARWEAVLTMLPAATRSRWDGLEIRVFAVELTALRDARMARATTGPVDLIGEWIGHFSAQLRTQSLLRVERHDVRDGWHLYALRGGGRSAASRVGLLDADSRVFGHVVTVSGPEAADTSLRALAAYVFSNLKSTN